MECLGYAPGLTDRYTHLEFLVLPQVRDNLSTCRISLMSFQHVLAFFTTRIEMNAATQAAAGITREMLKVNSHTLVFPDAVPPATPMMKGL